MKYSIHDGPGIRTTVFFKGCPLHCWWCHNPESQAPMPEVMLWADRCIGCRACLRACPNGAIIETETGLLTDRQRCRLCLACVKVCHAGARVLVGRSASVDEVMAEVEKDRIFYDESGGGVTFSGGEPLMQPDFLLALAERCRAKEIHTAVETTGFGKLSDLLRVARHIDLFLYDLKLMDEAEHRKYTGVSNQQILSNLAELSRQHSSVIVRIPIVPGVNDAEANLDATCHFISGLPGVQEVHLLPYHNAGAQKYLRLGRPYQLPDLAAPDAEQMERLAERMSRCGKRIKIGG